MTHFAKRNYHRVRWRWRTAPGWVRDGKTRCAPPHAPNLTPQGPTLHETPPNFQPAWHRTPAPAARHHCRKPNQIIIFSPIRGGIFGGNAQTVIAPCPPAPQRREPLAPAMSRANDQPVPPPARPRAPPSNPNGILAHSPTVARHELPWVIIPQPSSTPTGLRPRVTPFFWPRLHHLAPPKTPPNSQPT
jgi:hypothetical protein